MSISVTLNPGNRQFYNNTWYVGGQNVIVDNTTAASWIIANIADVSPNQPAGLVETFPSQSVFNASLTPGVPVVGQNGLNLLSSDGKTSSIIYAGAPGTKVSSRYGVLLADANTTNSATWQRYFGGTAGLAVSSAQELRGVPTLQLTGLSNYDGVKNTIAIPTVVNAGSTFTFAAFINDATAFNGLGTPTFIIQVSGDAAPGTNYAQYNFGNDYTLKSGWNILSVRFGEDGTTSHDGSGWSYGGNYSSSIWNSPFIFNFFNILYGPTVNPIGSMYLDSVWIDNKPKSRLIFMFDNVDPSILSVIAPALAAYGWQACNNVDGQYLQSSNQTQLNQILNLYNNYGWEIGSMGSPTSHNTYSSVATLQSDLAICLPRYTANGLPLPTTFAFPNNSSNYLLEGALPGFGFNFSRSGGQDTILSIGSGPNTQPGISAFQGGGSSDGLLKTGFTQLLGQNFNALGNQGTVSITTGTNALTFSQAPANIQNGYAYIWTAAPNSGGVFIGQIHGGSGTAFTLLNNYAGATLTNSKFVIYGINTNLAGRINSLAQKGGLMTLFTHYVSNAGTQAQTTIGTDPSTFFQLLDLIDSLPIDVITPNQAVKMLTQPWGGNY